MDKVNLLMKKRGTWHLPVPLLEVLVYLISRSQKQSAWRRSPINRDKCGAKLYWLRSPSEIIGDRFIDPKEWTNVPVPMTQYCWSFNLLLHNQAHRAHLATYAAWVGGFRVEVGIISGEGQDISSRAIGGCACPVHAVILIEPSPIEYASIGQEEISTRFVFLGYLYSFVFT